MHPSDADVAPAANHPRERPWLFAFLIAPVAVLSNGLIGGVLSYLLRKQSVSLGEAASLVALLNLPQTIYFLWSPITDFWIRRRTWLMLASVASAIAIILAFQRPHLDSHSAVVLIFLSACFCQLVVASCGGMMGTLHSETNRRRASSFYQSGSLCFGALALFVLAILSDRFSYATLGWITAAMIVLPSAFAFAAPETGVLTEHSFRKTFARIWKEFKETFLHWRAIPYTITVLVPMGSGAMIQLLPGLAADYHVTGHQVAWINGLVGSLLTAAGALVATLVPTRIRATIAYPSVCLVNAATLCILFFGPLQPSVYVIGAMLFLFTIGACYALFTAVVLEFLGNSGKSGSGRYAIINSLGNVPVAYMVFMDGRGYAHFGARGMSGTDIVLGGTVALLLLIYFSTWGRNIKPATA
jgi:MFS family permease